MNVAPEVIADVVLERVVRRAIASRDAAREIDAIIEQEEAPFLVDAVSDDAAAVRSFVRTKCMKILGALSVGVSGKVEVDKGEAKKEAQPLFKELKTAADIGKRLRELRLQKQMTQTEVAKKADIEQANLCRIEKGKVDVCFSTVFKVLQAMRLSLRDLVNYGD
jgi:DNA-binding XRE family transcriptional regulator